MSVLTVCAADGRGLSVQTWGPSGGRPVFMLHGTPGCRLGPRPKAAVLHRLGMRLISYDRPGYGDSDRLPGRVVAHAAADVEAVADALEIEDFAVVGRSGGGPHALACAALLPDRVSAAAVLVGLAPRTAQGLDWYAGMSPGNVEVYRTAELGFAALAELIGPRAELIRSDPAANLPYADPGLPRSDRRVVADFTIRTMLVENFAEALKHSGDGWIDDVTSFSRPWGFDLGWIRAPMLLWHGALDIFSPVGHSRWLAGQIETATLAVETSLAHFGAVEALPQVFAWLTSPDPASRDWRAESVA
jgi:pimeloyl-ACP methyl ester carboxylesterase